jgi:hypothetical protein
MEVEAQIYTDHMVIAFNGNTRTFTPEKPYSSARLLVGNFDSAESCLKRALQEMHVFRRFSLRKPKLVMRPKEKIDGGLSQVEIRLFQELGLRAGARRVEVMDDGKFLDNSYS